jgi:APA family basic amino acid/polyamine antiporter
VAWLDPRTRVPVVAIALQGVLAVVIALSGRYEQILNYVISIDFVWFGLTAVTLFVFRNIDNSSRRFAQRSDYNKSDNEPGTFRVPGHPWTTGFFVAACALVVAATVYNYPRNSVIGWIILVTGVPIYFFWRWWRRKPDRQD